MLAGFALSMAGIRDSEAYRNIVREQCSIAVAENAMKWGPLRPAPDSYFFDDADELLRFTEANRIRMRGHNLCWHRQLPDWFAALASKQNARSLLTAHIRTVAGRYAGRMHSWDVVNESIQISDGRADGLRNSPWLSLIGEDYIELAFRTAREADPSALLTYNEYGIEAETPVHAQKRAAVMLLLRRLRQRNVPIDAVGIQSHLAAGASHRYGEGLRTFLRECRELNLEVFLTEMDVDDRELLAERNARDGMVADTYEAYLNAALPSGNVRALLTWGVYDRQTWLDHEEPRKDGLPQRPLLFDDELRPKPAYSRLLSSLQRYPSGGAPI